MSRDRWARLEPLIDIALALPLEERPPYCSRVSADDPALGTELRRLLDLSGTDDGLLSVAAVERFGLLFDDESGGGVDDVLGRVQASLGDAYRLTREIGGGGMSRVFIADEPGLGRTVVIKVLSPELSAGVNADRFARLMGKQGLRGVSKLIALLLAAIAISLIRRGWQMH